jgi:hypothetical protein
MNESIELVRRQLPETFYDNNSGGTLSLAGTHMWCNRMDHGQVIRTIRSEAAVDVPEAAARTGFSARQFERWESGSVYPREATVIRAALALEVPLLPLVMNMTATEAWKEWGNSVADDASIPSAEMQ